MSTMTTQGTPITRRRRGKGGFQYDPESGKPWRTTLSFDSDNAVAIMNLIETINDQLSAATVVNTVIALMPKGPSDPPLTRERLEKALKEIAAAFPARQEQTPADAQEVLPMTG
ncbi:hypothetical protein [Kitasatospora purpeofusca]|uniref:hypothetical protein n=1 Tax=Kitasatospora purpeofusca TaxID=67352 RepID=UPI0036A9F51D